MFPREKVLGRRMDKLPFSQRKAFWQTISDTDAPKSTEHSTSFGVNYRKGIDRSTKQIKRPASEVLTTDKVDGLKYQHDLPKRRSMYDYGLHNKPRNTAIVGELYTDEKSGRKGMDRSQKTHDVVLKSDVKSVVSTISKGTENQCRNGERNVTEKQDAVGCEKSPDAKYLGNEKKGARVTQISIPARKVDSLSTRFSSNPNKSIVGGQSQGDSHSDTKQDPDVQNRPRFVDKVPRTRRDKETLELPVDGTAISDTQDDSLQEQKKASRLNLLDPDNFRAYKDYIVNNPDVLGSKQLSITDNGNKGYQTTPYQPETQITSGRDSNPGALSSSESSHTLNDTVSRLPVDDKKLIILSSDNVIPGKQKSWTRTTLNEGCKPYESVFLGKREKLGKPIDFFSRKNIQNDGTSDKHKNTDMRDKLRSKSTLKARSHASENYSSSGYSSEVLPGNKPSLTIVSPVSSDLTPTNKRSPTVSSDHRKAREYTGRKRINNLEGSPYTSCQDNSTGNLNKSKASSDRVSREEATCQTAQKDHEANKKSPRENAIIFKEQHLQMSSPQGKSDNNSQEGSGKPSKDVDLQGSGQLPKVYDKPHSKKKMFAILGSRKVPQTDSSHPEIIIAKNDASLKTLPNRQITENETRPEHGHIKLQSKSTMQKSGKYINEPINNDTRQKHKLLTQPARGMDDLNKNNSNRVDKDEKTDGNNNSDLPTNELMFKHKEKIFAGGYGATPSISDIQPRSPRQIDRKTDNYQSETSPLGTGLKIKESTSQRVNTLHVDNDIETLPITVCKEVTVQPRHANAASTSEPDSSQGYQGITASPLKSGTEAKPRDREDKGYVLHTSKLDSKGPVRKNRYKSHPQEVKEETYLDFVNLNWKNNRSGQNRNTNEPMIQGKLTGEDPSDNSSLTGVENNVNLRQKNTQRPSRPRSYPGIPAPPLLQNGHLNCKPDGVEKRYHSFTKTSYTPAVKSTHLHKVRVPNKYEESTRSGNSVTKVGGITVPRTPPPPSFLPPPPPVIGEDGEILTRSTTPERRRRRNILGRSLDSSFVSGDESIPTSRSATPTRHGYMSYDESEFSDATSDAGSVLSMCRSEPGTTSEMRGRRRRRRRRPQTLSDYEAYDSEFSQDERTSDYETSPRRRKTTQDSSKSDQQVDREQVGTTPKRSLAPSQRIRERVRSKTTTGANSLPLRPTVKRKVFNRSDPPPMSSQVALIPDEVTNKASKLQLDLIKSKKTIEKDLSERLEESMEKYDVLAGAVKRSMSQSRCRDKVHNANSEINEVIQNDIEEDYDNKTMTYKVKIHLGEYTKDVTARKISDNRVIVSGSTYDGPKLSKDIDIEFPDAVDMKHLDIVQMGKKLEIRVPYKFWKPRPTLTDALIRAAGGDDSNPFNRLPVLEGLFRSMGLPWPPEGSDAHYEYLTGRFIEDEEKEKLMKFPSNRRDKLFSKNEIMNR